MARRSVHRLWLAMVVVAAGIGVAGGLLAGAGAHADGSRDARSSGPRPGVVSIAPTAVDAAVVPGRTVAGSAADVARQIPGRVLLPLVAALVGLAGIAGLAAGGRSRPPAVGRRPLLARRYAIALRAPPVLQLG